MKIKLEIFVDDNKPVDGGTFYDFKSFSENYDFLKNNEIDIDNYSSNNKNDLLKHLEKSKNDTFNLWWGGFKLGVFDKENSIKIIKKIFEFTKS